MPSSVPCNVPYVLRLVARNLFSGMDVSTVDLSSILAGGPVPIPAFRILDVGCGFGKWGFLIRDTFDVMMGQRFRKEDWRIWLTGVEPFEPCITGVQRALYNEVVAMDVFAALAGELRCRRAYRLNQ